MRDATLDLIALKLRYRFLVHVLLPPLLGAIFILIAVMVIEPSRSFAMHEIPPLVGAFIVYGYIIASAPSFAYACTMEVGYRCGVEPGRRVALVISAALGFWIGEGWMLSGKRIMGLGIWPIAGLLTGLIVECAIGWLDRRLTPSSSVPSRTSPLP